MPCLHLACWHPQRFAWLDWPEALAAPAKGTSSAASQPIHKQAKSELPDTLYTPSDLIITRMLVAVNSSLSEHNDKTSKSSSTESAEKDAAKIEAQIGANIAKGRTYPAQILNAAIDKTSSVLTALRKME